MATLQELESALVKADAVGNTEDAKAFADEIRRMRSSVPQQDKPIPTFTPGPEGFRKSLNEAIAADVSPIGAQVVGGIGTALDQAALRAKQLMSTLTPQDVQKVEANRMLSGTPSGMVGSAIGNTMMFGGVPVGSIRAAAGTGAALSAATNPVLAGESEIANAALGAAGSVGGSLLARGAARVVQPMAQSSPVQRLMAEGIVPTPGQAAGAGSFIGRAEEKAQSIPLVGDLITRGRRRAVEEFNTAALERAAVPGTKVTQPGRAGLESVERELSGAYDRLFAGQHVTPDQSLANAVVAAQNTPALPLNTSSIKTFNDVIKKNLWDRIPTGGLDAGKMKSEIVGDLGKVARQHLDSPLASDKALGEALMAARNAVQGWLSSAVSAGNPAIAAEISAVDKAYANKVLLAKAVERAKGTPEAIFTPNQLQSSTRPGTPLRELANTGQDILSNRFPSSGTADRLGLGLMLGAGGLSGANEYYGGPGYLTALGLAPLLYSRAGSRYILGDLPGQQAVAEGVRSVTPIMGQLGRLIAEKYQ